MHLSLEEQFLIKTIREQQFATLIIRVEHGQFKGRIKREDTCDINDKSE